MNRRHFLRNISLAVGASFLPPRLLGSVAKSKHWPEFSWDRVPLYGMIGKSTAFLPEELRFLARCPLVSLEKNNGYLSSGCTEAGSVVEARAIKEINPQVKILFYRNIFIDFAKFYKSSEVFLKNPDWILRDDQGEPVKVRNFFTYDLTKSGLREWWSDAAAEFAASPYCDGLFIDAVVKALASPSALYANVSLSRQQEMAEAFRETMKLTRQKMGPEKLLFPNLIRAQLPDSGLSYLDLFSGSYLENFEKPVGKWTYEDYVTKGLEALTVATGKGAIIANHLGFNFNDELVGKTSMDDFRKLPREEQRRIQREGMPYRLGLFLISAGEYSYFNYASGYEAEYDIWMEWYPEYDRRLGQPKGVARREGLVYTRSFENVEVMVDLGKRSVNLQWKS